MRKILSITGLFVAAVTMSFGQTTARPEQNNSEQAVLKLTQECLDAEDPVDRAVLNIEQHNVPQSSLDIPSDYTEITAPGARRPPASSPPPGQSTPATE